MGWGKYIVLCLAFVGVLAQAEGVMDGGLCTFDTTSNPTLPYATCVFPTCPQGANCFPPTIDKATAQIVYSEPLIQWKDICPNTAVSGACWEVHMDFNLRVKVSSPNGVGFVGVNLSQEVSGQRTRNKYWAKAATKDASGRYELTTTLVSYVPPGQRLMLEVHELCAQDNTNNQGCIIPLGGQILTN